MDLISVVLFGVAAWICIAVPVFALCRSAARSDSLSDHLYVAPRTRGGSTSDVIAKGVARRCPVQSRRPLGTD
jgi:protein tyrosine phosphatase (PTP) superfamily phosphohydrolase (DUF442 family)